MINNDEEGILSALSQARIAASQNEVPVGAIVVRAGQIVGVGYNQREQLNNPVAHAEILAIQDAARNLLSWRLIDCTLYCTLEPCPMCLAACQQSRVKGVVFGAWDIKGGALSLGYLFNEDLRTNHRFVAKCVETFDCSKILKEFFAKKRSLR
jgi:tRNA(adenine34) deaminase